MIRDGADTLKQKAAPRLHQNAKGVNMDETSGGIEEDGATVQRPDRSEHKGNNRELPPSGKGQAQPKKTDRGPQRAGSISDLPPDRQAEIASNRAHQRARSKHVYRPQLPSVVEAIELHSNEIHLAFIRFFEPCNQYAIAIDTVARERLTSRVEFNSYLQDFDEAIALLSEKINTLYASQEELSAGSKTVNRAAVRIEANIQTRRSLQLLRLFKTADDIIRMVQFLNIYNDLDDRTAIKVIDTVINAINRCGRALRKVKIACFRRIIEAEQLAVANSDEMTVEDLHAARRIARIGASERKKHGGRRKDRQAVIDPGAPALLPVGEEFGLESGDVPAPKETKRKRVRTRQADPSEAEVSAGDPENTQEVAAQ